MEWIEPKDFRFLRKSKKVLELGMELAIEGTRKLHWNKERKKKKTISTRK